MSLVDLNPEAGRCQIECLPLPAGKLRFCLVFLPSCVGVVVSPIPGSILITALFSLVHVCCFFRQVLVCSQKHLNFAVNCWWLLLYWVLFFRQLMSALYFMRNLVLFSANLFLKYWALFFRFYEYCGFGCSSLVSRWSHVLQCVFIFSVSCERCAAAQCVFCHTLYTAHNRNAQRAKHGYRMVASLWLTTAWPWPEAVKAAQCHMFRPIMFSWNLSDPTPQAISLHTYLLFCARQLHSKITLSYLCESETAPQGLHLSMHALPRQGLSLFNKTRTRTNFDQKICPSRSEGLIDQTSYGTGTASI